MKKTKTIHGWAPKEETLDLLMSMVLEDGAEDALYAKQIDAGRDTDIKRMTIRITIEDYKPNRKE